MLFLNKFINYYIKKYCIRGVEDEVLYARALNLLSHGKYSVYGSKELVDGRFFIIATQIAQK
jgi:hypothetical protein